MNICFLRPSLQWDETSWNILRQKIRNYCRQLPIYSNVYAEHGFYKLCLRDETQKRFCITFEHFNPFSVCSFQNRLNWNLLGTCILCKVYQPNKLIHTYTKQDSFEPSYYLAREGPLTLKAAISSFGLRFYVQFRYLSNHTTRSQSESSLNLIKLSLYGCCNTIRVPFLCTYLLWADWELKLSIYASLSLVLCLVCSNINITEYCWVNGCFNLYLFCIIFFPSGNETNSLIYQFSNMRLVVASSL